MPFLSFICCGIFFIATMAIGHTAVKNPSNKIHKKTLDALNTYEKFTIYSLDPSVVVEEKTGFHGYKILDKKDITNRSTRSRIKNLLLKNVATYTDLTSACFEPGHGIKLSNSSERSIDILICFQCNSMYIFEDKIKYQVLLEFPLIDILENELKEDSNKQIEELLREPK